MENIRLFQCLVVSLILLFVNELMAFNVASYFNCDVIKDVLPILSAIGLFLVIVFCFLILFNNLLNFLRKIGRDKDSE